MSKTRIYRNWKKKKNPKKEKKPELLSPAGDWPMLRAAINAGADAVYFGVKQFNMRITAQNFEVSELKKVCKACHNKNVKAYLSLNTIIYDNEIEEVKSILKEAASAGIDGVICWDFAVINECRKLRLPVHISTQASVSNIEAARFYKNLGAERIVLARECSLDQIREIKRAVPWLKIEAFVHGSMCVSISGRCYTSQFLFGKSANRGDCLQPCRREYKVRGRGYNVHNKAYEIVDEENNELVLDNNFVMSAKDLCTIDFLDKLIKAGIDAFKIEGRNKSAEYVSVVTKAYRRAIDAYFEGKLTDSLREELKKELATVFNRGFSNGFYMGVPINEFANIYGSKSTEVKEYVGVIKNFFKKVSAAEVLIEDNTLRKGDEVFIIGPTTGCVRQGVERMEINHKEVKEAKKGQRIALNTSTLVRPNDKVFVIRKRKT